MKPNWAEENLQTIRTLMERSALYRRALAPIMTLAGIIGCVGGLVGWQFKVVSNTSFVFFWSAVACVALTAGLLLMRRQALKDSEPFWSPPTRRVATALFPAFFVGLLVGAFVISLSRDSGAQGRGVQLFVITTWSLLYGCAVHSAGFFMPRGVRLFAWIFICCGCMLMAKIQMSSLDYCSPNLVMGALFGGLHLAYGIYLYFTEKKNPAV